MDVWVEVFHLVSVYKKGTQTLQETVVKYFIFAQILFGCIQGRKKNSSGQGKGCISSKRSKKKFFLHILNT